MTDDFTVRDERVGDNVRKTSNEKEEAEKGG
jgi:hypothetical protein